MHPPPLLPCFLFLNAVKSIKRIVVQQLMRISIKSKTEPSLLLMWFLLGFSVEVFLLIAKTLISVDYILSSVYTEGYS